MPERWAGGGVANGQLDFECALLEIKYIAKQRDRLFSSTDSETPRLIVPGEPTSGRVSRTYGDNAQQCPRHSLDSPALFLLWIPCAHLSDSVATRSVRHLRPQYSVRD